MIAIDQILKVKLKGSNVFLYKRIDRRMLGQELFKDYYLPFSPCQFYTIIPEEGIRLNLRGKAYLSNIQLSDFLNNWTIHRIPNIEQSGKGPTMKQRNPFYLPKRLRQHQIDLSLGTWKTSVKR